MQVERLAISDIPALMLVMKNFEAETGYVKVDVDLCTANYTKFCEQGIAEIAALRSGSGELVGGLGCIIHDDLHWPRKMAVETFWFVLPEYRGDGLKLFAEFEKIAKERGCDYTAMIHLTDSHPEALEKIYRRKGYELVEKHYVRRLK